jgi:hypothetical protein
MVVRLNLVPRDSKENKMTIAELLRKQTLTAGEMKRLGKRVRYFRARMAAETAEGYQKAYGGVIYTGIHRSNDWSKTAWWDKGWHVVNRTKEYAVVIK